MTRNLRVTYEQSERGRLGHTVVRPKPRKLLFLAVLFKATVISGHRGLYKYQCWVKWLRHRHEARADRATHQEDVDAQISSL